MKIDQQIKRIERLRRRMEDRQSSLEAEHGKHIQALLRRWVIAAHDPATAYSWMIPHENVRINWEVRFDTIYAEFRQRDDKIHLDIPLCAITDSDERTLLEFEERRKAYKDEMDRHSVEETAK